MSIASPIASPLPASAFLRRTLLDALDKAEADGDVASERVARQALTELLAGEKVAPRASATVVQLVPNRRSKGTAT
ncbi:MAG: hypothetical protein HYV09_40520 [Deltaproteobacteria bacterium]|nr:hypothetical protein [Deltaproteobacteria bacterium]